MSENSISPWLPSGTHRAVEMRDEAPAKGPEARKAGNVHEGTAMENGISAQRVSGYVNGDISVLLLQPESFHHVGRKSDDKYGSERLGRCRGKSPR